MELHLTSSEFEASQELIRINEIRSSYLSIKRKIEYVLVVTEKIPWISFEELQEHEIILKKALEKLYNTPIEFRLTAEGRKEFPTKILLRKD